MNAGDPFHVIRPLLSGNFVAKSVWHASEELPWSAERIGAVTSMYRAMLLEGLRAAAAPDLAAELEADRDAAQLTVSGETLGWRMHPLEVLVGVSIAVSTTPLASDGVNTGADLEQLKAWLGSQLVHINELAGRAVASLIAGLSYDSGSAEPLRDMPAASVNGYLKAVDIASVRSERVPVEFTMLFDTVAGAAQQMMPLSDVLAVAKTMSIDDETVLGCVNYYIDKRYMVYDREHQIIRLTPHGRAAVTNAPKPE